MFDCVIRGCAPALRFELELELSMSSSEGWEEKVGDSALGGGGVGPPMVTCER